MIAACVRYFVAFLCVHIPSKNFQDRKIWIATPDPRGHFEATTADYHDLLPIDFEPGTPHPCQEMGVLYSSKLLVKIWGGKWTKNKLTRVEMGAAGNV